MSRQLRSKKEVKVLVDEQPPDSETCNDDYDEETDIENGAEDSNGENDAKSSSENEAVDYSDNSMNYFVSVSQRAKRSKNTLHDVDLSCLKNISDKDFAVHVKERKQLFLKYETELFPTWYNLMTARFNVILHGFGSKKNLLDKFIQEWLVDEHHCVIHGYFAEISLKNILNTLKEPLKVEKSDEITLLASVAKMKHNTYIVVHSLDGLISNDKKIKPFLRQLVSASKGKIHIIASVDHVNSGLLWSSHERHLLNWVWFETPTFVSYSLERSFSNSSFAATANSAFSHFLTLSSIQHVYDSLTPNAQKIFLVIAKHYLKDGENKDSDNDEETIENPVVVEGLPFATLYRNCREEFLVNSEITLRSQLTEFKDHKLVKSQKNSDGSEVVVLLVDLQLIRTFVDKICE